MSRKVKKRSIIRYLVFVCFLVTVFLAAIFLMRFAGNHADKQAKSADAYREQNAEDEAPAFKIRFLDVGDADAALICCDGKVMLIDGGNAGDSSLIYSILKREEIETIDYIVCTHVHEDHVGGLSGALNYATVGTAFCSETEFDSRAFKSFVTFLDKQNKTITVPTLGQTFSLGSATVQIVGPTHITDNHNNNSIVLRIVYGQTSFLFTGDAELAEENEILETGYEIKSTVLKVAHHGSDTSTGDAWIEAVSPKAAVISVGKNGYGHPAESTLDKLKQFGVTLYRTDMQGDIVCVSDGQNVTFSVTKNADADTYAGTPPASPTSAPVGSEVQTPDDASGYVLNVNTLRFHDPDCPSAGQIQEENRQVYTGTRDDLIEMGYTPCGRCRP